MTIILSLVLTALLTGMIWFWLGNTGIHGHVMKEKMRLEEWEARVRGNENRT
jgi:hypothetical protein